MVLERVVMMMGRMGSYLAGLSNWQQRVLCAMVLIPVVMAIIFGYQGCFFMALGGLGWLLIQEYIQVIGHHRRLLPLKDAEKKAWHFGGIVYIIGAMIGLGRMHYCGGALFFCWVLVAIIWSNDTFAYVFGRLLKGPRLAPSISPNKTWSGFLCAIIFSTLWSSFIAKHGALDGSFHVNIYTNTALISVIAHGGDLLQSRFKRFFCIKDTGTILPGHGGWLDRCDSLLGVGWGVMLMEMLGMIRY
jgi:phosphatidate cytidylyltransferase